MKIDLQLRPPRGRAAQLPAIVTAEANFGPWVLVRSSNIRAARYRESDQTLDVAFHGGTLYRYTHVPKNKFTAFVNAPSAGQYHHQQIKKIHASTKMA